MAYTFPTLSNVPANPTVIEFRDTLAIDPTIRSPKDAGYVQTRARFTRLPRAWHIVYAGVTTTDRDAIRTFEETVVVGANSFSWTNPDDSIAYTVRFLSPIRYRPWGDTDYERWRVEFDVEEV